MNRIAIVEDKREEAKLLESILSKYKNENDKGFIIDVYKDAFDFLDGYSSVHQVVFMDIELPGLNGIEAAEKLRKLDEDISIIFVTHISDFAIKGYEVGAIDYVVKPVTYSKIKNKMNRLYDIRLMRKRKKILLKTEYVFQTVFLDSIIYVEVEGHYLYYHTLNQSIKVRGTLKEAYLELKAHGFQKCNKAFIVNLAYVDKIEGNTVFLHNLKLEMSRTQRNDFIKRLDEFCLRSKN